MSDDEIEKMVKDAELHAEEDKKFKELVSIKNQGDALVHATNKSLEELGEKVTEDDQKNIKEKNAASSIFFLDIFLDIFCDLFPKLL